MNDIISLTFVPANEEISEYEGTNNYWCGLELTAKSIDTLVSDIQSEFFSDTEKDHKEWPTLGIDIDIKNSLGYEPEVIFQLGISILSGTVGVAFFKLLKLWITERNGRKVRVKLPNGFEIETTQLSHKEFNKLFEKLYAQYGDEGATLRAKTMSSYKNGERKLVKELKKNKLLVLDKDEVGQETLELKKVYRKKARDLGRKL